MLNIKRQFFVVGFLSFFFISGNLLAQKINQFNDNKERTGIWKKYHSNKKIRYEGEFKNGKEIGIFKFYDVRTSDYPIIIKKFDENSDFVSVQFFSTTGKLQSEGIMKNREREGKWVYYSIKDKILSTENYVNGKLEGEAVTYYIDGKVAERSFFKNGLKTDKNSKYSSDGILIEEVTFKNGLENGVAKYFDLKGNLKEKGSYKDGKRLGDWDYYIDGEIASDKEIKEARGKYKKEN